MDFEGYDVIGDLHGHADALERLLIELGYVRRAGSWRHGSRQAVFVGDLIDRGPQQLECVSIVRAMVESGAAQVVLGNHEYNALAYGTPDPSDPERHLRPGHLDPDPGDGGDVREKNFRQHRSYLEQVGGFGSAIHRKHLDWFRTIPLWLDLDGLRVVHACWHIPSMDAVRHQLGNGCTLTDELLARSSRKGTDEYEAVEVLLKGPEIDLGGDRGYHDKDGHPRTRARRRWWHDGRPTLRELALIPGGVERYGDWPDGELPDDDLPAGTDLGTYTGDIPVVVGHYWESGDPKPYSTKVACTDYSVAKGGKLVAYRWKRGRTDLEAGGYLSVEAAPGGRGVAT